MGAKKDLISKKVCIENDEKFDRWTFSNTVNYVYLVLAPFWRI